MTAASTAASYFSSFLTQANSKYTSIRRQLTSSEADGDTEDDTHVSRVLRAYYTEKGRPFPEWLPPDPKAPPPQVVAPVGVQGGYGGYGRPAAGGGLKDLWDSPGGGQPQGTPGSLRRGGAPNDGQGRMGGGRFADLYEGRAGSPANQGGYQPQQSNFRVPGRDREQAAPSPTPSAASGNTAKDLLKARLMGSNRTTSPVQANNNLSPGSNPYSREGAASAPGTAYGREGGGNDSFGGRYSGWGAQQQQSQQQSQQQQPQQQSSGWGNDRRGAYGGSETGNSRPNMYSSSSWSSADAGSANSSQANMSGYGSGYGQSPYGQTGGRQPPGGGRVGLPSGPRPQR